MKSKNYEDMIMKRAMDVFAEEGLKFFGIEKRVKEVGSTEIIVLEAKNMFMDYTFLMEDDTYIHIEFQTTNKGVSDLRRFKAYESLFELQVNKEIVTYVIYSGNIKNPITYYKSGINTYNVNAISMANKNGDRIFENIVSKINKNETITREDLIALTFTPIMGGSLSIGDKILNAMKLVKEINTEYKYDIESMLYAFASKFLKGRELDNIKEELKMTELGKGLIEEGMKKGMQEGIEKGIEKGKSELLIKLLMKKFKKLPGEYKEKIKTLPEETLDLIGIEIFDLENVNDLEKYF